MFNLFRTILTGANIVLAAVIAGLIATGCVSDAAGLIDCSKSFISPAIVGYMLIGVNILKLVIRIPMDGLGGLFK